MPINRYNVSSPEFFEPDESTEMVKYVDLAKFLSIIKNSSLFFCRIDKLEDKFEGTFPEQTFQKIVEWSKYMRDEEKFFHPTVTDESLEKSATEHLEFQNGLRTFCCVNCWNKFEEESYALWKIYAGLDQGIMLKTSFSKLITSFKDSSEIIYCSDVRYIDYNKDYIGFGNTMIPVVHKHKAYNYENEIRLVHWIPEDPQKFDWKTQPESNGLYIPLNLEDLFECIIISPFAPKWYKPLIEDLIAKYELNVKVIDSKLR